MTSYLDRLVNQNGDASNRVKPRLPFLFEQSPEMREFHRVVPMELETQTDVSAEAADWQSTHHGSLNPYERAEKSQRHSSYPTSSAVQPRPIPIENHSKAPSETPVEKNAHPSTQDLFAAFPHKRLTHDDVTNSDATRLQGLSDNIAAQSHLNASGDYSAQSSQTLPVNTEEQNRVFSSAPPSPAQFSVQASPPSSKPTIVEYFIESDVTNSRPAQSQVNQPIERLHQGNQHQTTHQGAVTSLSHARSRVKSPNQKSSVLRPVTSSPKTPDSSVSSVIHKLKASESPSNSIPPAPTIQVTIGRIEVRATTSPKTQRKSRPAPSSMSLDDYLQRRGGSK